MGRRPASAERGPAVRRALAARLALAVAFALAVAATLLSTAVAAAPSRRPLPVQLRAREPKPGDFLIASRQLDDANFAESVILLIETSPEGAAGVVVNRPTPIRLAAALPQIAALHDRADHIWWGGPVEPQGAVMLLRLPEAPADGERILDDVYMVRTRAAIETQLGRGLPEGSLRVFSGYAGWAGGQLEWEISLGSWYLHDASADRVFSADAETLWRTLVRIATAPLA